MLSILLPVYNWNVGPLVRDLHEQALQLALPFEIRVYDDASPLGYGAWKSVGELPQVVVRCSAQNEGRARLRNRLASDARGNWLLFLDADAAPPDAYFLGRYWQQRHRASVLCGGTAYADAPPEAPEQYLRWHFGRHREQRTAARRTKAPYAAFSTFNFMIRRETFRAIRFDDSLRHYGHEDTLFGWELERRGIAIHHLDNPLLHLGLDSAAQFLEKTRQGIRNLHRLRQRHPGFGTRLVTAAERLGPFGPVLSAMRSTLENRLLGIRPRLWMLDVWKLGVYRDSATNNGQ